MKTRSWIVATAIGGLMLAAGTASARQNIKDLPGSDAVKAFDVMTSRGFTSVDTFTTPDGRVVTWWYNASTGQGSVAIASARSVMPGDSCGSKGQGVELVSGGRGLVFEAVELALVDHVHRLDAGDQGARASE